MNLKINSYTSNFLFKNSKSFYTFLYFEALSKLRREKLSFEVENSGIISSHDFFGTSVIKSYLIKVEKIILI